ncbi:MULTISPECIES: KPN_02809 family neutral zinc metallopeptidase [unclassified Sphingomonas]|uniref:KPN_02809 family neutral zinc metallopeptidase n=1 Tax=unclassified Sphingomonas TaxID=196159 RepID=UPI0006FDAF7C|nr:MULTISPECIES: neutral zinc metallopeptidase [unclassified Sphingomonas]KQM28164.1 zinc metalloprotease [Sphingomonas sp. Leaf9]KQM44506.1 zinc metalloprotease [Sphingomonas sp. Leaf11]
MRLDDLDPSSNVDDLGRGGGGGGGLNLLGFLPLLLGRGLGCGTIGIIAIIGVAFLMFSGGGGLVGGGSQAPSTQQGSAQNVPCDTAEELFACRVLKSTEQVWGQIYADQGARYTPPRLRFYEQGAQSGCGAAQSAMGPFYCPPDRGVYLDTGFFRELSQKYGAGGDFAQAYVVAHEVGHHIQNLTGQAEAVSRAQQTLPTEQGNAQSVRLELQADCYAGVWAKRSGRMEPGDIEEGLRAAEAIGDDRLQGNRASPESFTHGTSAQRAYWLKRGYETGDPARCDTFSGTI